MSKFSKRFFTAPENTYAPGYFWILNGALELKKLYAQLDDMASHGIKAVCVHPFPQKFRPTTMPSTMSPDYMSPEYMDIMTKITEHAKELGMNAWLYDEGGWPSGGCCGQVRAAEPERFAAHSKKLESDGTITDVVAPYVTEGPAPYVSVIEPGVTEKFIELTHEKWLHAMSSHFGKTLKFTFTDEPNMTSFIPGSHATWCQDFAEVFKAEKGYDITPYLPKLLSAEEPDRETQRMRIDYCDVRANLFINRYLKPIQKWCKVNHMYSGGHLNGEDEPRGNTRYGYGHILRGLRALDVPGVDVIWRQLYPGNKQNQPFPKYASSAAHQNGTPYVLSESFGIYGENNTPYSMKWLIDYQLVRGVNVFVIGYSMYESTGRFMTCITPNFSVQNTIWDFMSPLYTYAARIGSLLGNGTPAAKTAVLYDIHAIWAGGKDAERAVVMHYKTAQRLLENHQDFDFVDDEQIAAAKIIPGGICIGKMTYTAIVLPSFKWLTEKALDKLDAFQKKGGLLLDSTTLKYAPKTCLISGKGKENIRVTKSSYNGRDVYFFVNESNEKTVRLRISLDDAASIVRCDPATGAFIEVYARNGAFVWEFAPFDSALFMTNTPFDVPAAKHVKTMDIPLNHGWRLKKAATYRAGKNELEVISENADEVPVQLGDWRPILGENFSGKACYSINFDCALEMDAILDLGTVAYCASVRLNGKELPLKFFGPFCYDVSLKKGENLLEVTIANTMANALGDANTRNRIFKDFPPKSPYEDRLAVFNLDNHESGLFGPVVIHAKL